MDDVRTDRDKLVCKLCKAHQGNLGDAILDEIRLEMIHVLSCAKCPAFRFNPPESNLCKPSVPRYQTAFLRTYETR